MTDDNRDPFAPAGKQPDAGDDPQQQPPDPILALIAEEARLREIGCKFREQADNLWYALSKDERQRLHKDAEYETDLPAPIGELYAQAEDYEDASSELVDQMTETKPTTIAGVVELLLEWGDNPAHIDNAFEALRDIDRTITAKDGEAQ